MAPLPIIADTVRAEFNWTHPLSGQHAVNVMHFHAGPTELDGLAASLLSEAEPAMFGQITDTAAVTELHLTPLDGSSATKVYDLSSAWVGQAASTDEWEPAPSLVLTLRTGLRGRSYRGRVFLPFIDEGAVKNGFLLAPVSGIESPWNEFLGDMAVAEFNWVVASYLHATAADVTEITVNPAVGTQRRRQSRLR